MKIKNCHNCGTELIFVEGDKAQSNVSAHEYYYLYGRCKDCVRKVSKKYLKPLAQRIKEEDAKNRSEDYLDKLRQDAVDPSKPGIRKHTGGVE